MLNPGILGGGQGVPGLSGNQGTPCGGDQGELGLGGDHGDLGNLGDTGNLTGETTGKLAGGKGAVVLPSGAPRSGQSTQSPSLSGSFPRFFLEGYLPPVISVLGGEGFIPLPPSLVPSPSPSKLCAAILFK